jgi:hypothetical protein
VAVPMLPPAVLQASGAIRHAARLGCIGQTSAGDRCETRETHCSARRAWNGCAASRGYRHQSAMQFQRNIPPPGLFPHARLLRPGCGGVAARDESARFRSERLSRDRGGLSERGEIAQVRPSGGSRARRELLDRMGAGRPA